MSLKQLFIENPNIVINTDIDGFLCGMVLQKYYDCKVVGFSNSRETVWLCHDIDDIDSPIYIDLYVSRPNVICIEQHIIAFNQQQHRQIQSYGTKMNPNLERERTFIGDMQSDYYHKYPFGTIHYLISIMEREGVHVELPDLERVHRFRSYINPNEQVKTWAGHVILRADDALFSTLRGYPDNAHDWWNWLDPNGEYDSIQKLKVFISKCKPEKAWPYKDNIGAFFMGLGCDDIDGAFDKVTDAEGVLLDKVKNYRDVIGSIVGMDLTLPEVYSIHTGVYDKDIRRPNSDMSILNSSRLYSYAFIFGPGKNKANFSYTTDLQ